jgi:hypothetical protein
MLPGSIKPQLYPLIAFLGSATIFTSNVELKNANA